MCSNFSDDAHLLCWRPRLRFIYIVHQTKIKPYKTDSPQQHDQVSEDERMPIDNNHGNGNLTLDPTLFTFLFGQDVACIDAPVLMLCCNKGNIFSYTMQSAHSGNLQLFCPGSSPVISVSKIRLVTDDGSFDSNQEEMNKNKSLDSLRQTLQSGLRGRSLQNGEQPSQGLMIIKHSGNNYIKNYLQDAFLPRN